MTDLVKLLREAAMSWRTPDRLVCDRAADRIEKLEAALREIIELTEVTGKGVYLLGFTPTDIARKALEGKDD